MRLDKPNAHVWDRVLGQVRDQMRDRIRSET
jgi:hypothetical protein